MTDRREAGESTTSPTTSPPTHPGQRAVASFATYAEAERAVDYLSDHDFPVGKVAIIGHDLKWVEKVTGRMNYGTAAWHGAATGALPGLLIGWFLGLFDLINPILASVWLAIYGLIFGAIVGALLGLLIYALQRGRRDFSSVNSMQPSTFELLVDADVADRAARMLGQEPRETRGGTHSAPT